MNEIKKVSDITVEDVAEYIRLDDLTQDEKNYISTLIIAAKSYMSQYTGRTEEELDSFPDFVIVVFVLCQDMYDNRSMYVDKANVNQVVSTILGMHSVNLL